jgi:hypothetical protein
VAGCTISYMAGAGLGAGVGSGAGWGFAATGASAAFGWATCCTAFGVTVVAGFVTAGFATATLTAFFFGWPKKPLGAAYSTKATAAAAASKIVASSTTICIQSITRTPRTLLRLSQRDSTILSASFNQSGVQSRAQIAENCRKRITLLISNSSHGTWRMLRIQYDKICTEIFKFDRRVRFASVLDESGRTIAGGMRRGISPLEPTSQDLRLIANITIQLSTDKTWDQYFGKTQYTFIKREKLNVMTFHVGSKMFLVSTEPDFTLQQAQELRNQIVSNHSENLK